MTTFYIENWDKIDKIDKIKYKIKTVKYLEITVFAMAGVEGFEPSQAVLEAKVYKF